MLHGTGSIMGMSSDNNMVIGHSSSDIPGYASHTIITKQEKDAMLSENVSYNRRGKNNSTRSDGNKNDEKMVVLHSQVQEMFANNLSKLLNDPAAQELQCCVTYGKPCGCIRKYILVGIQWKEDPNLRIGSMKDKDTATIAASDFAALKDPELARARELLTIFHHAAELKKEKCYITTEGADGKPTKELRGMIGLGNGRKRSKKYEDFVLDRRGILREKYSLCEKAAQKLLGYSINFLYKKLRTNPQKTSRLVATNKAERAAKGPRHLISLQQLQEMADNQQSSSQCCCRNCINWLVKRHFDKIVNWRKRLEGSGQRVAQQIVAEVLLVSASLDGQNSFCQNLVHWVTGCSFKKIRRVRDHLKKDPKSLPEHGLKKYWKEKSRKQTKSRDEDYSKNLPMKTEKDGYFGGQERFPSSYDNRNGTDLSNLNNSNNRYDNDVQFISSTSPNPPPNRTLPTGGMFSGGIPGKRHFSGENQPVYQQQLPVPVQQQAPNNQLFMNQGQPNSGNVASAVNVGMPAPYPPQHNNLVNSNVHVAMSFHDNPSYPSNHPHYKGTMVISSTQNDSNINQTFQQTRSNVNSSTRPSLESELPQYHEHHTMGPSILNKNEPGKYFSGSVIAAGFTDPNASYDTNQPSYYLAANAGNPQQEGFLPGMAPFFLTQAQQMDSNNLDQEGNTTSQMAGQQFFLLSPVLPNSEKNGEDYESIKHMMMPLTPLPMYTAPFFQGGPQNENSDNKAQAWPTEVPQQFVFSGPDAGNMMYGATADQSSSNYPVSSQASLENSKKSQSFGQGTQQPTYFQPALTPLAVMPSQGNNFFSGWFAAAPQQPVAASTQNTDSREYIEMSNANQQKNVDQTPVQLQMTSIPKQDLPSTAPWLNADKNEVINNTPQETNVWLAASSIEDQFPTQQNPALPQMTEVNIPIQTQITRIEQIDKLPSADVSNSSSRTDDSNLSVSPKAASVSNRKKRFSRDRLVASVDSPTILLPPMTPITPQLTPSIIAGINAAGNVDNVADGEKLERNQGPDDGFFRFPPTHVSLRMAALRMEGPAIDKTADEEKSQNTRNAASQHIVDGEISQGARCSDSSLKSESVSDKIKPSTSTVQSDSSSNSMTVEYAGFSDAKPVPLSIPQTCWNDENSETKRVAQNQPNQLQTPTPILNTPSSQSSPNLSTPSHQLHTPNQVLNTPTQPLNTPTQPLNTPTQPLNTPTDVVSPGSSTLSASDDKSSPVKPLLPVPIGKKRKSEGANSVDEKVPSQKQIRFTHPVVTDRSSIIHETQGSSSLSENSDFKNELKNSINTSEITDIENKLDASPVQESENILVLNSDKKGVHNNTTKQGTTIKRLSSAETSVNSRTNVTQLNTPVLVPTSAWGLRRGSVTEKGSSCTPQFFTFVPGSGFSTPVFFAPVEQVDSKIEAKGKLFESACVSDTSIDKSNSGPIKRNPMSLSLASKATILDSGLQTPSKIPVVTPSAVFSGGIPSHLPHQVFCFPHVSRSGGTSEKNKLVEESNRENNKSETQNRFNELPDKDADNVSNKKETLNTLRPPSLVVDPPSDSEDDDNSNIPGSEKPPSPIRSIPETVSKKSPENSDSTSNAKPTLHRSRSGGKKDLVISLDHTINPASSDPVADPVHHSPLNTPSGLQVITPTLATVMPTSKLSSPMQRFPPGMRVRPQPLMMTPICLTPGGNSNQISTPTFFHIISPNQVPPQSPSIVAYPYHVRSSGPLSTGSIASPAFGILQKAPAPSGSNSASLLKSALMKSWPIFQFPPAVRAPTPTSDSAPSDKETSDPSAKDDSTSVNQSQVPSSLADVANVTELQTKNKTSDDLVK